MSQKECLLSELRVQSRWGRRGQSGARPCLLGAGAPAVRTSLGQEQQCLSSSRAHGARGAASPLGAPGPRKDVPPSWLFLWVSESSATVAGSQGVSFPSLVFKRAPSLKRFLYLPLWGARSGAQGRVHSSPNERVLVGTPTVNTHTPIPTRRTLTRKERSLPLSDPFFVVVVKLWLKKNTQNIKFILLTIFNVQFSGVKYIHIVVK